MPNKSKKTPSHQQRNPQRSRSWWFKHYQAWLKSGLRKTHYCKKQGLNLSTLVNWTSRFTSEVCVEEENLSPSPVFFKAAPVSNPEQSGLARILTLGDISITFEQPISAESLSGWIKALQ